MFGPFLVKMSLILADDNAKKIKPSKSPLTNILFLTIKDRLEKSMYLYDDNQSVDLDINIEDYDDINYKLILNVCIVSVKQVSDVLICEQ